MSRGGPSFLQLSKVKQLGKLAAGSCSTGGSPCFSSCLLGLKNLPVISVVLNGVGVQALVDTGCSDTMVRSELVRGDGLLAVVRAFDGRDVASDGRAQVEVVVARTLIKLKVLVVKEMIEGVDLVLGLDAIDLLGGMCWKSGEVSFGKTVCNAAARPTPHEVLVEIKDKDFSAVFDGVKWIVKWVWKDGLAPVLKNKIPCYERGLTGKKKDEFEDEVERWIREGILKEWDGDQNKGILALMAVEQATKSKTRPVLDFRELNKSTESHTGDEVLDICSDRLREWRQVRGDTSILDLKSAYLQLFVDESLWGYQLVEYKGKMYCLTRLGFGLNCAPKVMTIVLKKVLSLDPVVERGTSSFIDDILVDESVVSVERVKAHLNEYGLVTKDPQPLDGGSALGLRIHRGVDGELWYDRGNKLPDEIGERMTRRELFSLCGKVVGHYPIAGWVRIACSLVKRMAAGYHWDDFIGLEALTVMKEIFEQVRQDDPVKGPWSVPLERSGVVWCDASCLGLGVVLEIGGRVAEDIAWLRKKTDFNHINVAELDALVKGLNLAVKWNLNDVVLMTDSATVHGWVKLALSGDRNIRTKGAAEVIIKRRLCILKNLVDELDLKIEVRLVPSARNKADVLTRVKTKWLELSKRVEKESGEVGVAAISLRDAHGMHHMGIDRSLYLARKLDPNVRREQIAKVVRECQRCQCIDPAPSRHKEGELSVGEHWSRVAVDVTHYQSVPYFSLVDCGPSRFAIWRRLQMENAEEIVRVVDGIFMEHGPVRQILLDNATVFRSERFQELLGRWGVESLFRAAYRPQGNGIVERHHRTIKAMAERSGIRPEEAVYWYNMSPRSGQQDDSVPQKGLFTYEWRQPFANDVEEREKPSTVSVGDEAWVKPPRMRCTTEWSKGTVTGVNSSNNISINGMPRHILDIRRVVNESSDDEHVELGSSGVESGGGGPGLEVTEVLPNPSSEVGEDSVESSRRSQRVRRPPQWLADYAP